MASNRRPAFQSDGLGNLAATIAAGRAFPAAVAELGSLGLLAMPTATTTWNPEAVRALYQRSVEACDRFFAGRKRPETANGMAFFDLCLAEYEVRKHLLTVDCFSSREALVAELQRLLREPVIPTSQPPCRADQYLASQKQDIEVEIHNLTLEQDTREKPWFQRVFGR